MTNDVVDASEPFIASIFLLGTGNLRREWDLIREGMPEIYKVRFNSFPPFSITDSDAISRALTRVSLKDTYPLL